MDEDRNSGVTEARFALTIVICLLVAIGYILLARVGGWGESTIEVLPQAPQPQVAIDVEDDEPQVLTADTGDDLTRPPHVAERSVLAPAPPAKEAVIPASTFDAKRR
jgi:hypothetical protein